MLPALVLCAGVGTRLDPLTRLVAKPAVPMAGTPLIARALSWLVRQGVTDVVINLHHRPETITGIVGDGAHLAVRVRYSWERQILGSAGGPRRALPLLDADTFFVVNGDTLCDVDLAEVLAAHERANADVTLVVVPNPSPDHYNGIVIDAGGGVQRVLPKGHRDETWHFIGIQVVRARLFMSLADGIPAETMSELYREHMVSRDWNIHAHRVDAPFVDVGTPYDYLHGVLRLSGGAGGTNVIESGADVSPSARVRQSVVWSGAKISDDVVLDECVVSDGVAVPAHTRARQSVLVPAAIARAGDNCELIGPVAVFPFSGTSGARRI